MKEKEPIAGNVDYGKDEDSSEALLKRHEAFMGDLQGGPAGFYVGNRRTVLADLFQFSLCCR